MSAHDDAYRAQAEADRSDVRRVLDGDVDAFAGVVARHQKRLLVFGRRFFRSHDDAEDFVQEVFIRAFRKLDTFRADGRLYSWLMSIAYNLAVRTSRQVMRMEPIDELSLPASDESPSDAAIRRESEQAVVSAMRSLPRKYAVCLDMFFFFDLSYQEISDTTGYPLNTVRSHIRRAKLVLKDQLADTIGGAE